MADEYRCGDSAPTTSLDRLAIRPMESLSPEQPGVPAAVPQVCSSTVYSMCPVTCGTCTEPNSCGKQLASVTPHPDSCNSAGSNHKH